MKKLLFGASLLSISILAGCSLPPNTPSAEEACLALEPIIQQDFATQNTSEITEGEGAVCTVLDVAYATTSKTCYLGYTCDGEGHLRYMISPITATAEGYEQGVSEVVDSCISFEDILVALYPNLVGDGLEQQKRASLCSYKEEIIMQEYQERLNTLLQ